LVLNIEVLYSRSYPIPFSISELIDLAGI
jgi:hypothetical protein